MSDKARLTIAAFMTAVFIAATSAVGILTHGLTQPANTNVPALTAPAPTKAVPTSPNPHHEEND